MLSFNDINRHAMETRGIHLASLTFNTVSIFSDLPQPKGLFIPIHDEDLGKAIENGAIAGIWNKNEELPSYTPNHFPIFLVDDPGEVLLKISEEYIRKLKQEECETMTKIAFYSPSLLNSLPFTYDIAVEADRLNVIETIKTYNNSKRRG
ncbi:hypothetical protein J6TS2_01860 [Heyndrickxia sporothermodurans]|nr:hypothetical protein J6TS2_01860 [Heyndrickxia sporothermodurans]